MEIKLNKDKGVKINKNMIGLFFEDINYAADGGLYAEMIENRSFSFVKTAGDWNDYYTVPAGDYGWSFTGSDGYFKVVSGSSLTEENPNYARVKTYVEKAGIRNKAYEGLCLKKGEKYNILFWARNKAFDGNFIIRANKDGKIYAETEISSSEFRDEKYNFWKMYYTSFTAEEDVKGAEFMLLLDKPGCVEFAYVSLIPDNAVFGIFRKDLFELLKGLKPGFLRFPGGCIVEGNTLQNRYRYKDSLKPTWERKTNWNRWAVHGNSRRNNFESDYAWYNQTLGLGFYEYFLLCEAIGAKALPVLNVGFACQYMSTEMVSVDSKEFKDFVQDALDLIEFANGAPDTKWGSVRVEMGHEKPFNLELLGIGNEQWQTERADFFERYEAFEKAIHERYPDIKLIGSAGPDITSEKYTAAWDFYRKNKDKENFVYAIDEHYYVKPEWLFEHNEFYDGYDRKIKVFSGEYAAHPKSGFNMPDSNTLWGALSEAAFLTGVERNADVVVLASYAPLFARVNYAQWAPDMIWFDSEGAYGTPSYYVQKLYGSNMGDRTVTVDNLKELRDKGIYVSASFDETSKDTILKVVNSCDEATTLTLPEGVSKYRLSVLTGDCKDACNLIEDKERVTVTDTEVAGSELKLPRLSFAVVRF
ncbi:MAG: alpha-L-arabinofuranosidase [Lachnospiraceae bacterium]|nr:alpha-L-arabinofuranosidase [Lachnospiraceae bacterium]